MSDFVTISVSYKIKYFIPQIDYYSKLRVYHIHFY